MNRELIELVGLGMARVGFAELRSSSDKGVWGGGNWNSTGTIERTATWWHRPGGYRSHVSVEMWLLLLAGA